MTSVVVMLLVYTIYGQLFEIWYTVDTIVAQGAVYKTV